MEEYKVLITTSGIGSRLGDLTKYTNKSLVRVGDKPAISHIIESYPRDTKFVVTLGHFGDHVKDFLGLAYPNKNFEFVTVDKYKGEGSSLLYSLKCAKSKLNTPFIFHAGDTIIKEHSFQKLKDNWVVGYDKLNSAQYRTFNTDSKNISNFNEKGELNYDFVYVGVAGISDYKLFWRNLDEIYKKNSFDSSLSDVHVIRKMLSSTKFKFEISDNWFDIGNTSELKKTRSKFKSSISVLDKMDENIFMFDNFVIKFFSNLDISKNRYLRGKILDSVVPKILDHKNNFFKYEKAKGKLFSNSANPEKFKLFLEWLNKNLWIKHDEDIKLLTKSFYYDKTISRLKYILEQVQENNNKINNIEVSKIFDLINEINFDELYDGKAYRIHGDLILDNVIETKTGFKLIDWRQDFGGELKYGDIYYDLAKLNHNLIFNHHLVDSGNYFVKENNGNISCDILVSKNLLDCREVLHKFILENGYDLNKVKLLTSIIWLNMSPLHEYPLNKFLFNFGKYNLKLELDK